MKIGIAVQHPAKIGGLVKPRATWLETTRNDFGWISYGRRPFQPWTGGRFYPLFLHEAAAAFQSCKDLLAGRTSENGRPVVLSPAPHGSPLLKIPPHPFQQKSRASPGDARLFCSDFCFNGAGLGRSCLLLPGVSAALVHTAAPHATAAACAL